MHVKETDLSEQSWVHNKKSRGLQRASSNTWWPGARGDSSSAVQPQHPGGSRWLPINPFHAFFPFLGAKLRCIHPGPAQLWTKCHPGALSDRGRGGGGGGRLWGACWLPLYLFCYISRSGLWCLGSLLFPRLVFCCAFTSFPPPPPSSSPFAASPSSWAATPPFPLLFHSQRLENLLKSSPSVPT